MVLNDYNRQFERDIGRHILNHLDFNIKRRETSKATHPTIFWRRHGKQSANDSLRDVLIQWMYTHTHTHTHKLHTQMQRVLQSCLHFLLLKLLSRNFPSKLATQQWWPMRKPSSCKKTPESPGCSSLLIGQKFFSGQSEAGISNASQTDLVRVSAQGFFSIL